MTTTEIAISTGSGARKTRREQNITDTLDIVEGFVKGMLSRSDMDEWNWTKPYLREALDKGLNKNYEISDWFDSRSDLSQDIKDILFEKGNFIDLVADVIFHLELRWKE